jgi:hypothetical protein
MNGDKDGHPRSLAVAMAAGVAVFTSSVEPSQDRSTVPVRPRLDLILLQRRRRPVLVLIVTSLGICVYYTLEYPPIGLALPIAAALFSAAAAGQLRIESAAQRRATTRIGMIDSQHSCAMIGEARYATGTEARKIAAGDRPITSAP